MSIFSSLFKKPQAPPGTTLAPDGKTVTLPDGSVGQLQADGTVMLPDGTVVAGAAYQPSAGQPHVNPTSPTPPVDLNVLGKEIKGAVIGGAAGLVVGSLVGFAVLGPLGARVGGIAVAALGGWIGSKV